MANPFFSGRIPQELNDRVDQHIKESGEGKTQILINALSQYLGVEISKPKFNNVNTELFLSELESLKERVSSLERSHVETAIEPIKIAEIPHKQMSLLDQASDNDDNNSDNTVTVKTIDNIADNITVISDDNNSDNTVTVKTIDNIADNITVISDVIDEQILTTKEVEGLMGISRKKLDYTKTKNLFPVQSQGYEVIGYAGKQEKAPNSNLWTVKPLTVINSDND